MVSKKVWIAITIIIALIVVVSVTSFYTGSFVRRAEMIGEPCSDECYTSGRYCIGDDIYSCANVDEDECKEKTFIVSCSSNEKCSDGYCIKREYCGDDICQSDESCSSCLSDCGECKKSLGAPCSFSSDCESGYCVHKVCRSTSTYCGDGYCDSDESCESCYDDCGSCPVFTIGDSSGDSNAHNYEILGKNYYRVVPSDSSSAIVFPLTFNAETRDVTFKFGCYDGISRFDSYPNQFKPEDYNEGGISKENKSLSIFGYFGYGSAKTFILSNNEDFGTELDYISAGGARVILFPSSHWGSTRIFNCELTIVSRDPPYREKKEFKMEFT